jgi:uncharacterized protein (UPF0332 family)
MFDETVLSLSNVRLQASKEDYISALDSLAGGHFKTANNRAYYCIFHAMRAVLALDGKDFKSHSQLVGYFNREYIKTGEIDREFSKVIKKALDIRHNSDYADFYVAVKEESEELVKDADLFLREAENYIKKRTGRETSN